MRVYSTIVLCLFMLFSCGQPQNSTTNFLDEKGKFKITFPIKPKIIKQSDDTEYGEITTYSFKAEPKNDDNLSYEVHYIDYPEDLVDNLSTKSIYELFNGSQTTNINSDKILIGTFNHHILGYPGTEFSWQDNETKKLLRVRFFMVNNRMYILSVNTKEENNFNVAIEQFFESFELINTEPNPEKQVHSEKIKKIYKASFPKPTETREMESPTEYGNAKAIIELYQPKLKDDDNFMYGISTLKYPEDITKFDNFNLDSYFSKVIQTTLASRQTTLVSQKKISKSGIEGIEMKESFRGGKAIIKQWVFLKGNFQIAIQVMTIPDNDENDSMNDFFDSFEFVDN